MILYGLPARRQDEVLLGDAAEHGCEEPAAPTDDPEGLGRVWPESQRETGL